jgi:RNA polymerase sigma factor (sigma-70 family)
MAAEFGSGNLHDSSGRLEWFRTTQWTDLLQAKNGEESGVARAGLSKVCENYWRPIYTYLRRSGYLRSDAEDVTQSFFEHLLSQDWLKNVSPGNGKFRSFLLKSLKNFSVNWHAKAHAQKRGGDGVFIPVDDLSQEEEQFFRCSDSLTPENNYDRRWAESLMYRAIARLEREYIESGKTDLFNELKNASGGPGRTYAEIGARFNLSEGGVKSAVHRMRARLSNILRTEIRATVDNQQEVDEELRYLREALGR